MQKYEKGTNRVGAGRLPQIAEIFNVPIGALFKEPARTANAVPAKLITDPTVLKLLTAYADITDRAVRRCLSELVDRDRQIREEEAEIVPRCRPQHIPHSADLRSQKESP